MKTIVTILKIIVFFVLVINTSVAPAVQALNSEESKSILNDTVWYKAGAGSASGICSSEITDSNLPTELLSAINKLKSTYEQASLSTGVPWQLLAAVHYRESNNDPNRDLQAGNPISGPYVRTSTDYASYGYPKSMAESAEIAAKHLIASVSGGVVKKPINVPSPDPEAVKDVLFSYNGRADAYAQQAKELGFDPVKQPYEGSPYVMNNFDKVHENMKIITQDGGGVDGVDTRLGAFTLYSRLGGASASETGCSGGAVLGNAVKTAVNYAWPDYRESPYTKLKPEYAAAIAKAIDSGQYVGGLPGEEGVDCGGFVTRVMIDSGADPGYNYGGKISNGAGNTLQQQKYLDEAVAAGKYIKLGPQTDTSDLRPGDIAINSSHTFMFVGFQSGFDGNAASASVGPSSRSPMASNTYFSNSNGSFEWYRLK